MKLRLAHIKASAERRPAGYLDDLLARGSLDASGEVLELPDAVYRSLAAKYLPTVGSQAAAAVQAAGDWLIAGAPLVTHDQHWQRSCQCALCPAWDARARRCNECGCYWVKLHLTTEKCPLGRW